MAATEQEIKRSIPASSPSVLLLAHSAQLDGLAVLRYVMSTCPLPVVALTDEARLASVLRRAGAIDVMLLSDSRQMTDPQAISEEVATRLRAAAKHKVGHLDGKLGRGWDGSLGRGWDGNLGRGGFDCVVALGASTGGTQSTAQILKALPRDFPGIVVVQHMPPVFTRLYADNLDKECQMTIREAKSGDNLRQGLVLIAPGEKHMRLAKSEQGGWAVICSPGAKVSGHCPSVDELFFSVARMAGGNAVGVILTGMGSDGALGLCEMRKRGAYTIGQDESTCIVYGMPKEAYDRGGVCKQASLGQIAELLIRQVDIMRKKTAY